ncbi:MAG: hypothetical protein HW380_2542, partial [Magnetococcales bacterium]|nr:hypothetical protein [Magnetococcales bacterium]
PAGFGAAPQGFGFEFKQKASCLWGFGGEAPKVLVLTFMPAGHHVQVKVPLEL